MKIPKSIFNNEIVAFLHRVDTSTCPNGCWLWLAGKCGPSNNPYGRFQFKKKSVRAHRASYELFIKRIPKGQLVLHSCDVPLCVNPEHLFLGTHSENMRDRDRKGRGPGKFEAHQVMEIRHRYTQGERNCAALARNYGCTRGTMRDIITSKHFKWLPPIGCKYR